MCNLLVKLGLIGAFAADVVHDKTVGYRSKVGLDVGLKHVGKAQLFAHYPAD